MNSATAAYAAGIIDGEGYVAFVNAGPGRGRPRPQMEVSSTDPELIDWLREHCDGWSPKPIERGGTRKTEYRWRINGLKARNLAREIAPFMVIKRKREKVEELARWQPLRGPGAAR